jgi:hypothetical protein
MRPRVPSTRLRIAGSPTPPRCTAREQCRAQSRGTAQTRVLATRVVRATADGLSLAPRIGDPQPDPPPKGEASDMAVPSNPTDAELDAYILFRFAMLGIDISVLPFQDPNAQVDQVSVLQACRQTLRQSLQLLEYELDPQAHVATYYASPQWAWTQLDDEGRKSLAERKQSLGY